MNTFRSRISPLPIIMAAIAFVAARAIVATVPSSAQTEQQPWQMAVTGLAVAPGNAPGELHITWDAHPELDFVHLSRVGKRIHEAVV